MDERVKPLRDAFNEAAAAFADAVSGCPDSAWSNVCAPEGWTVGALAHHVAKGHARSAEWIATMTAGQPVRLTDEELDAENAEDAQRFAGATKDQVLALHQRSSALLRALLGAMSGEDLDRHAAFGPAGGALFPVERIAGAASRHVLGHLTSIREAVGGATNPPPSKPPG